MRVAFQPRRPKISHEIKTTCKPLHRSLFRLSNNASANLRHQRRCCGVFAGSGTSGYLNAQGTLAIFSNPEAVAADSFGNLYVADAGNARIRLITTNGTVTTFAGGGSGNLRGYGTTVSLASGQFFGFIREVCT
jgi:hypothetical protein